MSEVKVYNPGDTPVLITGPHTSVGGKEWATVRDTKEVRQMIEGGQLVEVQEIPGESDSGDGEQSGDKSGDNATTDTKSGAKSQSKSNKEG